MLKKLTLFLVLLFLIMGMQQLSLAKSCGSSGGLHEKMAQAEDADAVTSATEKEAVNVGNKICPVMDNPIDEETKATYEHNGKIYNFCCAGCIESFKKDPEKYIKKVEEELAAEPKGEEAE